MDYYPDYFRINEPADTLNTTRICGANSVDASIETSKIAFTHMKPNTVTLVNKDEIFDGIAAAPIVHFPIHSSLLITPGNILYRETLEEIMRLSPKGYKGIQVFLVGNISRNVEMQLSTRGYKTRRISGRNHYETACQVLGLREHFKNVLLVSGEDFSDGLPAAYWSAHHGDPILFVKKNSIPSCTLEALRRLHEINLYVIGSTKTIYKTVEQTLSKLPNVKLIDRIDGDDPYEISVNFAKYKSPDGEFGWGRNYRDGHAFTFGTLRNAEQIIPSVVFAHMGKHTPLLLIEENTVPDSVEKYIDEIHPEPPKDMPMPPFMHGYILGCKNQIAYSTQVHLDSLLSLEHEMMEDMMDMGHTMQ
jgi:putative cell wall-binding protein